MRIQRTHLAGFLALGITACARGERASTGGGRAPRRVWSLDTRREHEGPAAGRQRGPTTSAGPRTARSRLAHTTTSTPSAPGPPTSRFAVGISPPIVIGAGSSPDILAG